MVPFVMFEWLVSELPPDNQRVSKLVFERLPIILVVGKKRMGWVVRESYNHGHLNWKLSGHPDIWHAFFISYFFRRRTSPDSSLPGEPYERLLTNLNPVQTNWIRCTWLRLPWGSCKVTKSLYGTLVRKSVSRKDPSSLLGFTGPSLGQSARGHKSHSTSR